MSRLRDIKRAARIIAGLEQVRAERRTASGLAASYGLDSSFMPAKIKDISATGIYLSTEKRLSTGELITLVLEEQGAPENSADLQISLHARVARQGEDGIGLSFVLPPGLNPELWSVLVRNIVVLNDQREIAQMFRTLRTILFLSRICQAEAEQAILLLGGQLDADRTETLVRIALAAENRLASEPDADRMRAHPRLVASILEHGSWSRNQATTELWIGLLVSSCSVDAPDDSNQVFVKLLSQVMANQAKILVHACQRTLNSASGDSPAPSVVLSAKEMVALTGESDLTKNAHDVANLFCLGLLEKQFKFNSYREIESFDITPNSLGLALFRHCRGDREKVEAQLVETANAHLRTFMPPPLRQFNVFVEEIRDATQPQDAACYQIAITPSQPETNTRATKQYFSREELVSDLRRKLGYADGAIERFFADPQRKSKIMCHPLSEEEALYFGWIPEYDKR